MSLKTPKKVANKRVAEREAVKLWLAMPSWERQPKTQGLLAAKLGLSDTLISDWKIEPGFMDDVHRLARQWAKQFIPDVFGAMVHVAADRMGGTAQDRKLFLQYFEDWAPRERQEVTGKDGETIGLVFVKKEADLSREDAPAGS